MRGTNNSRQTLLICVNVPANRPIIISVHRLVLQIKLIAKIINIRIWVCMIKKYLGFNKRLVNFLPCGRARRCFVSLLSSPQLDIYSWNHRYLRIQSRWRCCCIPFERIIRSIMKWKGPNSSSVSTQIKEIL